MDNNALQDILDVNIHTKKVEYEILETHTEDAFKRQLIKYKGSENDDIKAYLFIPINREVVGSVLVHHQHNGERHLGKSEVAGIAGDPFQFFCPALAEKGIICLAPDSICFEDRRTNQQGILPDVDPDNDWLQHYNEMCYRLLQGKSLMKKVIEDSSIGISILSQQKEANENKIGILGHSYGGNTAIFHSPFDARIQYTCSSGAVCSYKTKFKNGTGIEMAEVIPKFAMNYDVEDLLKLIAPRDLLIVSATLDKYAQDAEAIYWAVKPTYESTKQGDAISLKEFEGEHRLNQERFDYIVSWFTEQFSQ